jgi:hypothetical protein
MNREDWAASPEAAHHRWATRRGHCRRAANHQLAEATEHKH